VSQSSTLVRLRQTSRVTISVRASVIGPAAMVRSSFATCNKVGMLMPSRQAAPTAKAILPLMIRAGQSAWSKINTTMNTTAPAATANGNAVSASHRQVARNHPRVTFLNRKASKTRASDWTATLSPSASTRVRKKATTNVCCSVFSWARARKAQIVPAPIVTSNQGKWKRKSCSGKLGGPVKCGTRLPGTARPRSLFSGFQRPPR